MCITYTITRARSFRSCVLSPHMHGRYQAHPRFYFRKHAPCSARASPHTTLPAIRHAVNVFGTQRVRAPPAHPMQRDALRSHGRRGPSAARLARPGLRRRRGHIRARAVARPPGWLPFRQPPPNAPLCVSPRSLRALLLSSPRRARRSPRLWMRRTSVRALASSSSRKSYMTPRSARSRTRGYVRRRRG